MLSFAAATSRRYASTASAILKAARSSSIPRSPAVRASSAHTHPKKPLAPAPFGESAAPNSEPSVIASRLISFTASAVWRTISTSMPIHSTRYRHASSAIPHTGRRNRNIQRSICGVERDSGGEDGSGSSSGIARVSESTARYDVPQVRMITFSLQSGSNGNATYVEAGGVRLLFDAGIPARRIRDRLAIYGRRIHDVHALLLSHDHHDHVCCAGATHR